MNKMTTSRRASPARPPTTPPTTGIVIELFPLPIPLAAAAVEVAAAEGVEEDPGDVPLEGPRPPPRKAEELVDVGDADLDGEVEAVTAVVVLDRRDVEKEERVVWEVVLEDVCVELMEDDSSVDDPVPSVVEESTAHVRLVE